MSALQSILIPLLFFLGVVGLGLLLKRILPVGATLHVSKNMVIALISGGAILAVLLTVLVIIILKK
jgi:hypothetical protein